MNGRPTPIQDFILKVGDLHEPDFGDFKRKADLYLSQLSAELSATPEIRGALADMRNHLVFNPNGHVESTRQYLIKRAHSLYGGAA